MDVVRWAWRCRSRTRMARDPATQSLIASGDDQNDAMRPSSSPHASLHAAGGHGAGSPPRTADEIYERYFDFVWRNVRRMGVPAEAVDDAVQDVFLVVHRRLAEFEGRSAMETWLFGILMRVARDHRRSFKRRVAKLGAARAE